MAGTGRSSGIHIAMVKVLWLALAAMMAPFAFFMVLHCYRMVACCWEKDPEVEELERMWRAS